MKIMVREMSLIRGLGAPAKEMSFRHLLALFKDLSCPLLPTIARHCPPLPAKKMLQAWVASQYGRGSRGPGRVPRAAPRQPGCTAEQRNHEPRSFLARGASRREFRGFHESRVTKHESRPFFAVGAPGRRHRKPPPGRPFPPPGHCLPARCGAAMARHGRHIAPEPLSAPRPHRQHGLLGVHESRDTNHGLYSWPFGSLWVGKSRTTRNCRRTAAPANKLLLALPPIPAISHHFPAKNIAHEPVSVHRQPFSVGLESSAVGSRILRKCAESLVCGRLHEVCRCPQLPSPCEFVPPRRNAE